MKRATKNVLQGKALWAVECAEALAWLKTLPTNCVHLVFFSPPYEDARTYGIGSKLKGQTWVDWMRPIVVEAARVSRGLVAVNMSCKVSKGVYSATPELLVADLIRLGGLVCGPSPYAWVRNGIAGSGSKHYHRRNWEPVYCFAEPEKLPLAWSDNKAFGHPPKWAPGGEMSHRLSSGERVNQWGRHSKGGKSKRADGTTQHGDRPSHTFTTKNAFGVNKNGAGNRRQGGDGDGKRILGTAPCSAPNGDIGTRPYDPPAIANHGNVIKTGNGGNQLGHDLAHENEAPMNVAIPERFACWYVPPGGILADPFCGSGTTGDGGLRHGRRFIGCDIRPGNGGCETAIRRLRSVTPALFPQQGG